MNAFMESKTPSTTQPEPTDAQRQRIKHLPREVGVLMLTVGVGGMILPGPIGIPFVLLGCVILWPGAFSRVETMLERRCPCVHREGFRQINRYLVDLEGRYPYGLNAKPSGMK